MAALGSLLYRRVNAVGGMLASTLLSAMAPARFISTGINFPLNFRASLPLLAEPMKKKKKLDPAIIKAREEKKRKRLEKTIKRLEKGAKQLKPVEEIQLSIALTREKMLRSRPETLSNEEQEKNKQLLKLWCNYKYKQSMLEAQMIDRICSSQQRALDQLKLISPELYNESIQMDQSLLPCTISGPSNTPPIDNYGVPDGEYVDVSPKWD